MNTRRSLRNVKTAEKQPKVEVEIRKRQKSKFDSSDESSEDISGEKEFKRSKPYSDDEESSSDNKKKTCNASRKRPVRKIASDDEGSSSESSVGDYLKPADKIDLNSSFFQFDDTEKPPDFVSIEKKMFSGVQRLSDEESESDNEIQTETVETGSNFTQMRNFNEKLEEAKACVQNYQRKETKKSHKVSEDINKLLSVGETKNRDSISSQNVLSSDDEDWEEIEEKQEEISIPKEGVQITVELPTIIRKKPKGVDMMAAIKRRINRIKKENQIYVHKVHLLCWIAHGNFFNTTILNNETLLGQALSLLPSEQCYPPKHADITYLEQIVRWYGKIMKLQETSTDNSTPVKEQLNQQICNKTATCKRNFVILFIIILRSLGLQCRLVLSLQCLPLRPPNSELFSVSSKEEKASTSKESTKTKTATVNTSIKNKINQSLNNSKTQKTKKETDYKLNITKTKKLSLKDKLDRNSDNSPDKSNVPKTKKLSLKEKLDRNSDNSPDNKSNVPKTKKLSLKEKLDRNSDNSPEKITKEKSKSRKKSSSNEKLDRNLKRVSNLDEKRPKRKKSSKISQLDGADDLEPSTTRSTRSSKKLSLKTKSKKPVTQIESDSDFQPSQGTSSPAKLANKKSSKGGTHKKKPLDVRGDIINLIKGHMSEERHKEQSKKVKKAAKNDSDFDSDFHPEGSDHDSDFHPELEKKRRSGQKTRTNDGLMSKIEVNTKVKRRVPPKSKLDRRALSSDEETSQEKKGNDVWIEVFLEEEEKWISVDLIKGQVHCVSELYNRASHPVSYILAWNNNLSLKDVTARYCPNWNTVTRKLRIDAKWWEETLKPFLGVKNARDKEEDEDLARQQLDQPLPKTIGEYKNHPLYALKRHLLKFQALYPPEPITLGFIRKEAVYARECVHTLHSREIWVKHAKVVKPGMEPYKIVKARPKYDRLTGTVTTDIPLELFGIWQVDDYVPPTAENGIVPRNAFGNVELFKSCMLPFKTVHLRLPGLNRVARKLRIDCAPAVVGFDFHSGSSHPTFDGYVVCEEFKDVLIAAWEEDQEETAKRELEKFEKRVWGNWRKLIKGLLIKERLKAKYDFGEPSKEKKKVKPSKSKKIKLEGKKE